MAIERIKIRARIVIGSLSVSTPYIQSFNVRKQRGQISTFDASLKVEGGVVVGGVTGGDVKIYAGTNAGQNLIFTGICRAAKISPCYDDPKYVILSISGTDQMILLQGKKYTRRCRSSRASWAAITGVVREGLKSGKFAYHNEATIELTPIKQEKEDVLTGHIGTAATDRLAPGEVPDINNYQSPPIAVEIINDSTGGV